MPASRANRVLPAAGGPVTPTAIGRRAAARSRSTPASSMTRSSQRRRPPRTRGNCPRSSIVAWAPVSSWRVAKPKRQCTWGSPFLPGGVAVGDPVADEDRAAGAEGLQQVGDHVRLGDDARRVQAAPLFHQLPQPQVGAEHVVEVGAGAVRGHSHPQAGRAQGAQQLERPGHGRRAAGGQGALLLRQALARDDRPRRLVQVGEDLRDALVEGQADHAHPSLGGRRLGLDAELGKGAPAARAGRRRPESIGRDEGPVEVEEHGVEEHVWLPRCARSGLGSRTLYRSAAAPPRLSRSSPCGDGSAGSCSACRRAGRSAGSRRPPATRTRSPPPRGRPRPPSPPPARGR